jgi:hypothetical protein
VASVFLAVRVKERGRSLDPCLFLITFILSFFNIIDNNMINGTKLLNAAGMSRGKRDGILKNERGRMVVKIGAMHLKGVW